MKTARQILLEYLQSKKVASASELSRGLRMSAANARHHLAILLSEGAIELVGTRPGRGRGRPSQLYSLSGQANRHNLDCLADALLQEALSSIPLNERAGYLVKIARKLSGGNHPVAASRHPTQRLNHAVQVLNQMNYQARWEAHSDSPRVIFGHCPYAAIHSAHPELCQMDAVLLGELMDPEGQPRPARLAACLEIGPQGTPQCIFRVAG